MQGVDAVYNGSCHCGRVTFELVSNLQPALRCNCSFCQRKGAVMIKAKEGTFKLLGGEDALTHYQFSSMAAKHYFCKVCGIYTFHNPRSNPQQTRANAGCLQGLDPLALQVELIDNRALEVVCG